MDDGPWQKLACLSKLEDELDTAMVTVNKVKATEWQSVVEIVESNRNAVQEVRVDAEDIYTTMKLLLSQAKLVAKAYLEASTRQRRGRL